MLFGLVAPKSLGTRWPSSGGLEPSLCLSLSLREKSTSASPTRPSEWQAFARPMARPGTGLALPCRKGRLPYCSTTFETSTPLFATLERGSHEGATWAMSYSSSGRGRAQDNTSDHFESVVATDDARADRTPAHAVGARL